MKNDAAHGESALPEITDYGLAADAQQAFLYAVTEQTPWWIVSVLLHGLIITLAGLMTMGMELPDADLDIVTGTIEPLRPLRLAEPPKTDPVSVFEEGRRRVQETDANGPALPGPAYIPDEVLRMAQLGEDYVTYDPDKPDKQSARGTELGEVFLIRGSIEPPGGGYGHNGDTPLSGEGPQEIIGIGNDWRPGNKGIGRTDGDGYGDGVGHFKGTFSNRPDGSGRFPQIARRRGATKEGWCSLQFALKWLATHQEYDGHWDAVKYSASVKTDTAVSAFALLTFLGAGHTERAGEYKDNVRRAVAWLKSKQSADGCIWDTTDDGAHHRRVGYPCAIATLALAEAAGMANVPETRAAAQKAIDYCTQIHQSGAGGSGYEKGGWRYAAKEPGDLSVTGWFIMALKSAKVAGLHVPPSAFEGAIKFLDSVEVKDGDSGSGYGIASHYKYRPNEEHAQSVHRLSAIGNLARQFLGWKKEELEASVEWFVNKGGVPVYGANGEQTDLYYWYYGSMCVFQQGGELFKRWNEAMKSALIPSQCVQGDDRGSWSPAGEFCGEWGRVGQTALSALCLEVYYRYDLMKTF